MFNINAQRLYSSRANLMPDSSACNRQHDILQREIHWIICQVWEYEKYNGGAVHRTQTHTSWCTKIFLQKRGKLHLRAKFDMQMHLNTLYIVSTYICNSNWLFYECCTAFEVICSIYWTHLFPDGLYMDQISIKTPNPKCRLFLKIDHKGTGRQLFFCLWPPLLGFCLG